MNSTEITFKIISETNCPSYQRADEFKLSGNALSLNLDKENTFISTAIVRFPYGRTACRILIGDLTNVLINYNNIDKIPLVEIECSGCGGFIRMQPEYEKRLNFKSDTDSSIERMDLIVSLLSNFSIFQSIDELNLRDIVPLLNIKKYPKGSIVLEKGTPSRKLYILLSGTAQVLDENNIYLSSLGSGDVFGEMSLISGEPVGATIKVVETASIVSIEGKDFKEILNKSPSVQMYLTKILAKRLAESNLLRAEEIASGITGQLVKISAIELLQALNLSQKTGTVMLNLPNGDASLYLKSGDLIKAEYCNKVGREAVYEILKEKEGQFTFNPNLPEEKLNGPRIGSFMEIILDSTRMIDEEAHI